MSKDSTYKVSTGKYFPPALVLASVVVGVACIAFIWSSPVVSAIFLIAGLAVITSDYKLEIDHADGSYKEYITTFGIPHSVDVYQDVKFQYLYLNKNKFTQNMASRGSSAQIRGEKFDGYLLANEDDKIHVFSSRKKEMVVRKLEAISKILDLDIVDNTA